MTKTELELALVVLGQARSHIELVSSLSKDIMEEKLAELEKRLYILEVGFLEIAQTLESVIRVLEKLHGIEPEN